MTDTYADEQKLLLDAVINNPAADGPRLDYADWLDRNGERDRARFIRVQCDIDTLKAEEQELLARHSEEWGRPLKALGADDWTFHRGFPEEISIRAPYFFNAQEQLAAITPIRGLTFTGLTDREIQTLVGLPLSKHLTSLSIGSPSRNHYPTDFGVEGLRTLSQAEALSGLTRLSLYSHSLGGEGGAKLLAASPLMKTLTHLVLDDPAFDDPKNTAIQHFVDLPTSAPLVDLTIGKHHFNSRHLQLMRSVQRTEGRSR